MPLGISSVASGPCSPLLCLFVSAREQKPAESMCDWGTGVYCAASDNLNPIIIDEELTWNFNRNKIKKERKKRKGTLHLRAINSFFQIYFWGHSRNIFAVFNCRQPYNLHKDFIDVLKLVQEILYFTKEMRMYWEAISTPSMISQYKKKFKKKFVLTF